MADKKTKLATIPGALISLAEKKAGVTLQMLEKDPTALGGTDLTIALGWIYEKTYMGYTGTFEEYGMERSLVEIGEIIGEDDEETENL